MEIPAHTPARGRRAVGALALVLALLACAGLSAAAFARSAARTAHTGRRGTCTTKRHAKHAGAKHCKRSTQKTRSTHKAKKPAAKTPAPKLTPALCEDGGAPARAADGSYGCEDGSEPACEDGSEPIRPSASSAPMCHVPREEALAECSLAGAGECSAEFACEDADETVTASSGCEYGSAFEEEGEPAVTQP